MKRVLLIAPSKKTSGVANWGAPPLGLHRIAAWLRSRISDVQVEVYDPSKDGSPGISIFDGYDVIGFSPLCETLASDLSLMNMAASANPQAVLVAGGVEATLNYQEILDKSTVQWIVLGDGERQMEAIVQGTNLASISGVVFRSHGDRLGGDDLWKYYQSMDFSAMGYEEYWEKTASLYDDPPWQDIRTVRLVSSTHCNRQCSFCAVTQWHRQALGKIVPPTMLAATQLLELVAKVKCEVPTVETIYWCEDDFCQSRSRVTEFCSNSAEFGLSHLVQTHSSRIDEQLVRTLKQGGVRHLTLGIENASEHVLASFNKPQKLERLPDIIRWCKAADITPYFLIILFAPESTVEDLRLNCERLKEWHDLGATISIEPYTMPYRGAPLYESLHQFGWNRIEVDGTNHVLKQATVILPDDEQVRAIMAEFDARWPEYRRANAPSHSFKGATGILMVKLLTEILNSPPQVGTSVGRWDYIASDRKITA